MSEGLRLSKTIKRNAVGCKHWQSGTFQTGKRQHDPSSNSGARCERSTQFSRVPCIDEFTSLGSVLRRGPTDCIATIFALSDSR